MGLDFNFQAAITFANLILFIKIHTCKPEMIIQNPLKKI